MWIEEVFARLQPADALVLAGRDVLIVAAAALVVVCVGPLWRSARLGVTLVHELGHAGVGVLVGRKFTGFVLRQDASGHAVTRGPAAGPGLAVTTWAGYPAPALLAAGIVAAVARGWSPPLLAVFALVLVVALMRVRSVLTAAVTLGSLAGVVALWWWGEPTLQAMLLLGLAAVLFVGAWRHIVSAARDRSAGNDLRVLARLTRLPWWLWLTSYVLVVGGCVAGMVMALA